MSYLKYRNKRDEELNYPIQKGKKFPTSTTLKERREILRTTRTVREHIKCKDYLFELYLSVPNCPNYSIHANSLWPKPNLIICIFHLLPDYDECIVTIFRKNVYIHWEPIKRKVEENALLKAERIVKELTAKDKQEQIK